MQKKYIRFCPKYFLAFIILLLSISNTAWSRPIISGISTNEINIDTNFSGAQVLLFGAKGDVGDIIITIRGPKNNYLVNKKDKFLGIWYNKDRLKVKDAYSYYAFFASNGRRVINDKLLSQLEIGRDKIDFSISNDVNSKQQEEFKIEFMNNLQDKKLYLQNSDPIEFLDETLFKLMLTFPKNISRGMYIVEIYLIDENNLVAFQAIPIYVRQVGISAKINDFAYNNSVLYGIVAILIAVIAGFLANFIFTKLFNK